MVYIQHVCQTVNKYSSHEYRKVTHVLQVKLDARCCVSKYIYIYTDFKKQTIIEIQKHDEMHPNKQTIDRELSVNRREMSKLVQYFTLLSRQKMHSDIQQSCVTVIYLLYLCRQLSS